MSLDWPGWPSSMASTRAAMVEEAATADEAAACRGCSELVPGERYGFGGRVASVGDQPGWALEGAFSDEETAREAVLVAAATRPGI